MGMQVSGRGHYYLKQGVPHVVVIGGAVTADTCTTLSSFLREILHPDHKRVNPDVSPHAPRQTRRTEPNTPSEPNLVHPALIHDNLRSLANRTRHTQRTQPSTPGLNPQQPPIPGKPNPTHPANPT
eukprot:1178415-Prorocentrum_minimum.AAC.2